MRYHEVSDKKQKYKKTKRQKTKQGSTIFISLPQQKDKQLKKLKDKKPSKEAKPPPSSYCNPIKKIQKKLKKTKRQKANEGSHPPTIFIALPQLQECYYPAKSFTTATLHLFLYFWKRSSGPCFGTFCWLNEENNMIIDSSWCYELTIIITADVVDLWLNSDGPQLGARLVVGWAPAEFSPPQCPSPFFGAQILYIFCTYLCVCVFCSWGKLLLTEIERKKFSFSSRKFKYASRHTLTVSQERF